MQKNCGGINVLPAVFYVTGKFNEPKLRKSKMKKELELYFVSENVNTVISYPDLPMRRAGGYIWMPCCGNLRRWDLRQKNMKLYLFILAVVHPLFFRGTGWRN